MADQPIYEPLDFSDILRLLEATDPGHADTFNPLFERLINNDVFLKAFADALAERADQIEQAHDSHKDENASTTAKGHVQLNDTVTSTSTTRAATASAVKTAYDKGNHSHPYAPSTHTHTNSQVGLGNVENYRQARSAQGYAIVKDGTDGTGIINFKTS